MKSKKLTQTMLIAVLSITLTGCFPTGKLESNSQASENVSVSESKAEISDINNIEEESKTNSEVIKANPNLKISNDLDLDIKTPSEVPKIKFTGLKIYSPEEVEVMSLFKDKKINKKEIGEFSSDFYSDNLHVTFTKIQFRFEYDNPRGKAYYHIFDRSGDKFQIYPDTDFENFPKEDAVKMVKSITDELGLTDLGTPRCAAISADDINEILDEYSKEHTDVDLTRLSADECIYYIEIPYAWNEIPTADGTRLMPAMSSESGDVEGSSPFNIRAAVARDGVYIFNAHTELQVDNREFTENVPIKYGAKDALDILLGDDCTTYPSGQTITDCKLIYALESEINVYENNQTSVYTPVWQFTSAYEDDLGLQAQYYYVRPDNGTVIKGD